MACESSATPFTHPLRPQSSSAKNDIHPTYINWRHISEWVAPCILSLCFFKVKSSLNKALLNTSKLILCIPHHWLSFLNSSTEKQKPKREKQGWPQGLQRSTNRKNRPATSHETTSIVKCNTFALYLRASRIHKLICSGVMGSHTFWHNLQSSEDKD